MKAAILKNLGSAPVYEEINEPAVKNSDEEIIEVKAAPLKNFDRARTFPTFYAAYKNLPAIIGSDGVGLLKNGTTVYGMGAGMFGEKAIVAKGRYVILPQNLDIISAAALPNAVLGSAVPLILRGNIKKGDTVIINGATGFTGQVAVQCARYFRAGRIIATGRNSERLEKLKELGATQVVSLNQSEETITKTIQKILDEGFVNIVLDYLWGTVAEMMLGILTTGPTHSTRFINLGNNSGQTITLDANTIRSSAIEIIGAGAGSYTADEMDHTFSAIIPEMYQLAAKGGLTLNTRSFQLSEIETVWQQEPKAGERLVAVM